MTRIRTFVLPAVVVVGFAIVFAGCQQGPEPAPVFKSGETTTYKVTATSERTLEFKGSLAEDENLKGGHTSRTVDMVFTSEIQDIDSKGNATARITIKEASYFSQVKDKPFLEFDSKQDADSVWARLIGQSYTIELAPDGTVTRVIDATQARAAVSGAEPANRVALSLLEPDMIVHIHSLPVVPAEKTHNLKAGDTWSDKKDFFFGMLGSRSHKRTYTVEQITTTDNHSIALVQMQGVSLSTSVAQGDAETPSHFSDLPSQSESYTGLLEFDLTDGAVRRYSERLEAKWNVVDPQAESQEGADSFIMGVARAYSIVKID